MKTFDEKDLITWVNRNEAEIGKEYYFGDSLNTIKNSIKTGSKAKLDDIINNTFICTFKNNCECYYSCILPVDAVKETEPEKKYRPCKTVKDFYELVSNSKCKMDEEECIYQIISDFIIHIKDKITNAEYYLKIISIAIYDDIVTIFSGRGSSTLNELFNEYEIEINGEWLPFGVED